MFGDQSTTGLAQQLCALEEEFQLKKLTLDQYENSKVNESSELIEVHFVIESNSLFVLDSAAVPFGETWSLPIDCRQTVPGEQEQQRIYG